MSKCLVSIFMLSMLLFSACSTTSIRDPKDPWEGVNRVVFQFNEACDKAVLSPIAKVYDRTLPFILRKGVSNFYANFRIISVTLNKLLQGDLISATESFMRMMINFTFGLGGVNDIATQIELPQYESDFGLTLAYWGVPSGPYLMLPIFGSSTLRDAFASVPEWLLGFPTDYVDGVLLRSLIFGIFVVNTRANLFPATDLLSKIAFDKYIFLREAYLQRRNSQYFLLSETNKLNAVNGNKIEGKNISLNSSDSNNSDQSVDPYEED